MTTKLLARWETLADQIGAAMTRAYKAGDEDAAILAAGMHERYTRVCSYLRERLERGDAR